MKICLVLQRRFSVFGHAIACVLREKYGVKEFCGYIYMRSAEKFLKSQKDIVYQPLLVDEDLYRLAEKETLDIDFVKALEKEYGLPNLWPYIFTDSHFMMSSPKLAYSDIPICSHEQMLKHLQVRFKAICQMLEKTKPDFIIFANIGALCNNILYYAAKKMGIKIITPVHARVGKRVTLSDDCFEELAWVNKLFEDIKKGLHQSPFKGQAINFLREFRENPRPSILGPIDNPSFPRRFLRWTSFFFKYLYSYLREKMWQDYLMESPVSYFRNRISRRLNKWRGCRDLFEKPGDNEDFAFFPLHYEPEITTLLQAPFYTNQIALIQNIAKSLPVHFKLYVKEHPAMLYRRSRSYYKALKKIPNLRLIDAAVPSTVLIKGAKIILTITGTAGWEAVLLKKPVIIFGSVFYNKLSMVRRIERLEELPWVIRECLARPAANDEELIDFLSALFELSLPLDYEYLWHVASLEEILRDKQFEKFVDYLAGKLELVEQDKTKNGAD